MTKKSSQLMRVSPRFLRKVKVISAEEGKSQSDITEEMVDFLEDWKNQRREKRKYEFKF